MDQLINSLEYIDLDTACGWLRQLTELSFPLTRRALMELCERYSTPVYIDCNALEGATVQNFGSRSVVRKVIGIEFCRVDSPVSAFEAFQPQKSAGIQVTGIAVEFSGQDEPELSHAFNWTLTNPEDRPFLFTPDDIKLLASLLKPGQNEETDQRQGTDKHIVSIKRSISDERLKLIFRWFREQRTYDAAQLSRPTAGLPGARDACWQWLTKLGLTARGALFHGTAQKNSSKSKKFISAWNAFLKEVMSD